MLTGRDWRAPFRSGPPAAESEQGHHGLGGTDIHAGAFLDIEMGHYAIFCDKGEALAAGAEAKGAAVQFQAKVDAMVEQFQVREESGFPVVKPPAGSDVYMLGRLWQWYPILELEKDQSYRLHLSSLDWQHGFSLQPVNINLQILPGYEMVLTVTPDTAGEFTVVCNEYCGIGHHLMLGKIYVKE